MRLIDADPLIEKIASIYGFSISSVRCSLLGSVIANAPTIDIVRCRECKKWNSMYCFLGYARHAPKADDFCSYGERKE